MINLFFNEHLQPKLMNCKLERKLLAKGGVKGKLLVHITTLFRARLVV